MALTGLHAINSDPFTFLLVLFANNRRDCTAYFAMFGVHVYLSCNIDLFTSWRSIVEK